MEANRTRRKRVRKDQKDATKHKITVYLYGPELASIDAAAAQLEMTLSGYMALAAKERAKSDLSKK